MPLILAKGELGKFIKFDTTRQKGKKSNGTLCLKNSGRSRQKSGW
jgi:hypothetical protein